MSLVPSETATTPSRTSPVPTRLHGLSPDHATTLAVGSRWRTCQYGDNRPTTVDAGAIGGSLASNPGAVASSAAGHHSAVVKSIRFIPDASPGSTGACCPMRSDDRNELTRWTRSVAAYAAASCLKNFLICGPVKRSNARDPVRCASAAAPPTADSISSHSHVVVESIQIGATARDNTGASCGPGGRAGSSVASTEDAFAFR